MHAAHCCFKNVSLTSHYRPLSAGILVVVPNYTGDCLNFGIAIKKTQQAGVKVCDKISVPPCINIFQMYQREKKKKRKKLRESINMDI